MERMIVAGVILAVLGVGFGPHAKEPDTKTRATSQMNDVSVTVTLS